MSEWKEARLGNVAEVQTGPFGSQLKNEQYITGGTPVVTVEHIKDFLIEDFIYPSVTDEDKNRLKKYTLKSGDIVFSRVGSVDLSALVEEHQNGWLFSSRMLRVRVKEELDTQFLSYYLRQPTIRQFIVNISVGSTMPSINTEILKSIPIVYCDLEEQKKIANALSCLDRKIDNLRRQNETLEEIARSIFKHWFIDFEFPNPDGKPYKSSGGVMVRSDLGDIPEGWQVGKLGDVATNNSETHKFEYKDKIIFVNTGDVLDGKFLHENYMSVNTLPGQAKKRIAKHDILYSEIRPKNKHFAYINFERNIDNYVVSTKFMVVRANDSILPRLLYLILKRQESIDEFNYIAESRSGTFPQITFEAVSHFQFPLPSIDIQKYLMPIFTNLMEKKEFNVIKIETLTKTRDALLPKLMSGQLRVNE